MTDRSTRRGFLAACSAAAAALGLTARAAPARPPILPGPISKGFDGPAHTHYLGPPASVSIISGGSGYTTPPVVTFTGGGGSGAVATATLDGVVSGIAVKTR